MTVPTAGFISDLDPASPTNADFVDEGDNWFRFLQETIKTNQFPRSEDDSSNGWDIACTAKCSQLNALDDLVTTESVETRLAALEADAATLPSGTVMSFFQAAAPSGWTQQTTSTYDNAMLRVVNTAGGGSGGSDSPILLDRNIAHVHSLNIVSGSHGHGVKYRNTNGTTAISSSQQFGVFDSSSDSYGTTGATSGSNGNLLDAVTVTITGDTDSEGGANWTPKYVDMIICSKD